MTKYNLNTPEGRIIASDGNIQISMNSGRCREIVLDQYFVRLLAMSEGLIEQFLGLVKQGCAYELMIGETPSEEVLTGKALLDRPMLTIASSRGDKFWFGFASKPNCTSSRHRRRVLVSIEFLNSIGGVAEEQLLRFSESVPEPFWFIRGKLADGRRKFSVNSHSANFRYDEIGADSEKRIGIKQSDAPIWEGLAELAEFLEDNGPGSFAEDVILDPKRPEYKANAVVLESIGMVSVTFKWNGFVEFEEVFSIDVLSQVAMLVGSLWTGELDNGEYAYMYEDDEDDEYED